MHDIRTIRDNPAAFDAGLKRRGLPAQAAEILEIDAQRRADIHAAEQALADRNAASKQIGAAKASGDEAEFERLRALVADKKTEIATLEAEAKQVSKQLSTLLLTLPNLPADDVPDGANEDDNVEIRRIGTPRKFAFTPKEHFEVAGAAKGLDFATAGKLSGARFVVLRGAINRLHRALGQFMLNTHVDQNGFDEIWTPVLVRDEAMYGSGQLPKFAEDSYRTENGWWLIPTAEVTLVNSEAGNIIDETSLPIRLTAHSQCFRSEAGSAGRDTSGMLRQHQFEKVEMVAFTKPEDSAAELERMTKCAEGILDALEIPYRTVVLCTGDLGFGMRKTYDIEAWLPGQNTYREISSCSVAGDFQARRMNTRFRRDGGKPEFVHTLNGSGLAVGRTLIAVIENNQQQDGSINIPAVLQPYMGDKTVITADGTLS
ncbi:MAG: serine--tRNA ligase [Rhodobacteraceae bacterium]|nr:serine--tRNA ligase [Paracoccaceae bacterium]